MTPADIQAPVSRRLRWRASFAATLSLAMGVGTFPGYAFGVLGPYLVQDFTLSKSQLGLLTTLFFGVGGLLSPAAGGLVDRLGGRRVLVASFIVLALGVAGAAAAQTFVLLLAMTALAGLALAVGNPVTNKLVAVHLPEGGRGVTMGVKQAGVQIGAFLTGALLAPAAAAWGWRRALAASVAIPLAGIAASVRTVPHDAEAGPRIARRGRRPLPPSVAWLTLYGFLMGAGVAGVNAYLPLYAVEELGVSVRFAGAVVALIGFVGIVSRVVWGALAERGTGYITPLLLMAAGAIVSIALIVVSTYSGPALLWPAALIFGATAVTWNSVGMLAIVTEAQAADAGRASGPVVLGFYVGFVPSPIAFGLIVDLTGSYQIAWIVTALIFMVASAEMALWRHVSGRRSVSP